MYKVHKCPASFLSWILVAAIEKYVNFLISCGVVSA